MPMIHNKTFNHKPCFMKRIIILKEPAITEYDISLKAGKRLMNRFCIDEDPDFELSGVYSSYKSPLYTITSKIGSKAKGKVNFDDYKGESHFRA